MLHLTSAYEELLLLANERKARLEESRRMWQFYWDMADEEAWIKEKEQIMSSPDLGHDLTSVHLLLTKHKVGIAVPPFLGLRHRGRVGQYWQILYINLSIYHMIRDYHLVCGYNT